MNASEFGLEERFEQIAATGGEEFEDVVTAGEHQDESFLDNIATSPIGRLLKIISTLPEVRREKVFELRRQIDREQYNLNDNLDVALDRVIEELIAEG